jgi:hypothetical protein
VMIAFPNRFVATASASCELRHLCHNETNFPTLRKLEPFRPPLNTVNRLPFYHLL